MRSALVLFALYVFLSLPAKAADCTNPEGVAGEIIFNTDHKVLQFCNSEKWIGMGWKRMGVATVPQTTKDCDAALEGSLRYNSTDKNMQFCDGAAWVNMGASDAGGNGLSAVDVQNFTSNGTWVKPEGSVMVLVECSGGGGGGGRGWISYGYSGGKGGDAGFRRAMSPAAALPASVSVTIGAAGIGRTGSTGAGTAGGTSSFGSYLNAGGGGGGIIDSAGTAGALGTSSTSLLINLGASRADAWWTATSAVGSGGGVAGGAGTSNNTNGGNGQPGYCKVWAW